MMAYLTFKSGKVSFVDPQCRMHVEPDGPYEGLAPIVSVERFYKFFPDPWCEHIDAYQDIRPADLPKPGDWVMIVYDNLPIGFNTLDEVILSEPIGWGGVCDYEAALERMGDAILIWGFGITDYAYNGGQTANVREWPPTPDKRLFTGHLARFKGDELPPQGTLVQFVRKLDGVILHYWELA